MPAVGRRMSGRKKNKTDQELLSSMVNSSTEEDSLLRDLSREAHIAYKQGRYRDTLKFAEEIYNVEASKTENLLLLGAVHFQLHNFSESVFYNQQCLRLEPETAEAYNNVGIALKELGDNEGAMQFLHKAIKYEPRYADAYNNLGTAHMAAGHIEDAVETYRMCLVIDPNLVDAHCNLGNLYKAQGKLEAARKCYLEAIRLQPDFAIAWSNLAGLFKQQGQLATAVAYYREAIRLCPPFADVYSNLGSALQEQGDLIEAQQCYEAAIKLRPDLAVAHGNLGSCLVAMGNPEAAVNALRLAIQLEPRFPDAYNSLGNALRALASSHKINDAGRRKKLDCEAIRSFRMALRFQPDHPHAYCNLGSALRERGMIKEAIHCNVTAARLMPDLAAAHSNLGSLLREQGRLEQAIAHYEHAVGLEPTLVEAHLNLGCAYSEAGNAEEASKSVEAALELAPESAEVHAALGALRNEEHDFEGAIAAYSRALELRPDMAEAHAGLVMSKIAVCRWDGRDADLQELARQLASQLLNDGFDEGELDCVLASKSLADAKLRVTQSCRNVLVDELGVNDSDKELLDVVPRAKTLSRQQVHSRSSGQAQCVRAEPFFGSPPCVDACEALKLSQIVSTHDQRRIARRYAARALANVALSVPFKEYPRATHKGHHQGRLRIAYLSSYFFQPGNVAHLMLPVLKYHDCDSVHVTCYTLSSPSGDLWSSLFGLEWEGRLVDISFLSPADAARLIHQDNVDVLVSLDGHMAAARNEILALRAAPVQIGVISGGYVGTHGTDYVDYLIVDPHVIYRHKRANHVDERLICLPETCFLNAHADLYADLLAGNDANEVDWRAKYGLRVDAFVFAYHGPLEKLDPITFDKWMAILHRAPNSILWLLERPPAAQAYLRSEARKRNIDDAVRLVFSEHSMPKSPHSLKRLSLADCALQPFAIHDAEFGVDALWAGLPLIAQSGNSLATRQAVSLLNAIQIPELIVDSLESYVDKAVSLAVQPEDFKAVKLRVDNARRVDRARTPLFDSPSLLRHLETGLKLAFESWIQGQSFADIRVATPTQLSSL